MWKTSCTSGILCSFHGSESATPLRGQGPNRGRMHAQDARRLLGRISEQVHEHEGSTLARGDLEEELPHVGAHLRIEEQIASLRDRDDLPDGPRGSTSTPPETVKSDAEEAADGVPA